MKSPSLFIIVAIWLMQSFSYCSTNQQEAPLESSKPLTREPAVAEIKERPKVLFNAAKPFEIISSRQSISRTSSSNDTSQCRGWTITKETLSRIIKSSEPIDGVLWHHSFDVLPCVIKGLISQGNRDYQFELNAGSWMYIDCADTTLIFGNFKREDEKYFLSAADKE